MEIDPKPILSKVGGKAYQLYRLKKLYNIPSFFCVAFEDPKELLSPTNQQKIVEQLKIQGFNRVAIRSSASCEDSADASFAGIFKTMLNVQPHEVISAISVVLNSIYDKRVSDYCEAKRLDQSKIRMAIIVQKMIESRVSGVCFTQVKKDANHLVIEACYGLGEALVSGRVSPDTYIVDRQTLGVVRELVNYQGIMFHPTIDSSPNSQYVEVPFHRRNAKKLTNNEIRDIAKMCLSIEHNLQFDSADAEWTFEKDLLYLLQARPYTGLAA